MVDLSPDKFKIVGYDKEEDEKFNRPSLSYWSSVRRRFFSSKVAIFAMIILIIIVVMIIIGPKLTKYDPLVQIRAERNMRPNSIHYFGTDEAGFDIFSRVWYGGRTSFTIGIAVATINVIIGIIYGAICGYFGGLIDDVIMRIIEIALSIPNLILVMLIGMILRAGLFSAIISMSVVGWCQIARLVRGQIMQVSQQEYVLAAQALGADSSRILSQHLITNVISIAVVTVTLEIPFAILGESILGYLGFLDTGSKLTWGGLMRSVQNSYIFYPYQTFIPAAVISITLICFNLIGDALSDALDPRLN